MVLDRQKAFNTSYLGLKSQGFDPSMAYAEGAPLHSPMMCAYRGEHGRRCAIGWLIPDDLYEKSLEGSGLGYMNGTTQHTMEDILGVETGSEDHYWLRDLQNIHDTIGCNVRSSYPCAGFSELMQRDLINFAKLHNLTIPEHAL